MSVPARAAAADQETEEHRPDPHAPGWADVRSTLITEAQAVRLAVEELALAVRDPSAGPRQAAAALEMARLNLAVMESALKIGRRWVFDEARLAAERKLGFDEGVAACMAARCRLELIQGGGEGNC